HVRDAHGLLVSLEARVELCGAAIPKALDALVAPFDLGKLEMAQELVHRGHDVRVRVEGAAGKADIPSAIAAQATQRASLAAHPAHRQAAAERLAVGDEVRRHAEIFLRAARSQPEPEENLVEDERDAALGADSA